VRKLPVSIRRLLLLSVLTSACGGQSVEANTYLEKCGAAQDLACEKGFSCGSFFTKAKFNSVEQCQSELGQARLQLLDKLDDAQLKGCASACDQMAADVESVSCTDFDKATFNEYSCGQ
jgi:hypothetical protein